MVDSYVFIHFVIATELRGNKSSHCLYELVGVSLRWV